MRFCLLLIFCLLAFSLSGQPKLSRIEISRCSCDFVLDGELNEKMWKDIPEFKASMHIPEYGGSPSEETSFKLGYDDNYIYFGAVCKDSDPDLIQYPSKKRDEVGLSNDYIGIVLDTYSDNENALCFFTTPAGLRSDFVIQEDAEGPNPFSTSWNTFWDVAVKKTSEGWTGEFRIPISSLRFQDKDGLVEMGLALQRRISRKNEVISYPPIKNSWGFWSPFKPSQMQKVVFRDLKPQKPIYIAPYVLAGYGSESTLNMDSSSWGQDENFIKNIGGDIKLGLSSKLTMDLSVNTDFAQVEVDDQQVNLTRFSLFYPEKRMFFLERSSVFDVRTGGSNRIFYSRRIGLQEGEQVPILGGVRLVGREGGADYGLINMQTKGNDTLNSENFTVLRYRKRIINPYSYIGVIGTNRADFKGDYNSVLAVDGVFRVVGYNFLFTKIAQSWDASLRNKPFDIDQSRIFINLERREFKGFSYDIAYNRVGKNYKPEMGFENRTDYTNGFLVLSYGVIPKESSKILRHRIKAFNYGFYTNESFKSQSLKSSLSWEVNLKSGAYLEISGAINEERPLEDFELSDDVIVRAGLYNFPELVLKYNTSNTALLQWEFFASTGGFYDGNIQIGSIKPSWNLANGLQLGAYYQFNKIQFEERQKELITHLMRLRAVYMLSTTLSVAAFVQYNSTQNLSSANFRFRFNPKEGNDLYLVYTDNINTERTTEHPVLPVSKERAILLKYTYTFSL